MDLFAAIFEFTLLFKSFLVFAFFQCQQKTFLAREIGSHMIGWYRHISFALYGVLLKRLHFQIVSIVLQT